MLEAGRKKLEARGAPPVLQADALVLPFADASADVITVAFGVRNLERLGGGLKEMARVLKPGGNLLVLEFGQPPGVIFGALYRWYSRVMMPRIGGALTGNRSAYSYLPATARQFPCGAAFEALLREAGLSPERTVPLTGGIAWAYSSKKN
jgi:demethylmenaquinone methyltransferase/2-methoxy-6-polyprenyl-1,4-benzoquinol methylase